MDESDIFGLVTMLYCLEKAVKEVGKAFEGTRARGDVVEWFSEKRGGVLVGTRVCFGGGGCEWQRGGTRGRTREISRISVVVVAMENEGKGGQREILKCFNRAVLLDRFDSSVCCMTERVAYAIQRAITINPMSRFSFLFDLVFLISCLLHIYIFLACLRIP